MSGMPRSAMVHRRSSALSIALVLAAPVLLVIGWATLIADAGHGANDIWAVGHLVLFVANGFWIPATMLILRRAYDGAWNAPAAATFALVIVGALSIAGQLAVDMAAWVLTDDAAGLSSLFEAMRSKTILLLVFYVGGPPLLFLGVLLAVLGLSRARPATRPWPEIVAVGLAIVLIGALTTFSYLTFVGYVTVLIGFAGMSRRLRSTKVDADDL
jgi:hypothetical protein